MSKQDAAVQLGMFGVPSTLAGSHVVAAHTRLLASGDEVFVGEHVRWNRGRSAGQPAPSPSRRAAPPTADDDVQPSLF